MTDKACACLRTGWSVAASSGHRWPDGTVKISSAQLGYLLEGIAGSQARPAVRPQSFPLPCPRVRVLARWPMRLLAMQMPCRLFHSAWHTFWRLNCAVICWTFGAPEGIRTADPQIAAPILIRQLPLMTAANAAKADYNQLILLSGAPEEIRTPDPQIRSLVLHVDPSTAFELMQQ
jgi:hypothetical protein